MEKENGKTSPIKGLFFNKGLDALKYKWYNKGTNKKRSCLKC